MQDGEPKKKAKRGRKPKSASAVLDDCASPIPTPVNVDVDPDASFTESAVPELAHWSIEEKGFFFDQLSDFV